MILHAGFIALRVDQVWRGALIEGPSGSGKSDLMLRSLALGLKLVADDRTSLFLSEGRLFGRAPERISGLLEVRGLGLMRESTRHLAEVGLIVRCEMSPTLIERMPEFEQDTLLGVSKPVLRLWPLEPSAPAKLRWALEHLGQGPQEAYQAALAPPRRRRGG